MKVSEIKPGKTYVYIRQDSYQTVKNLFEVQDLVNVPNVLMVVPSKQIIMRDGSFNINESSATSSVIVFSREEDIDMFEISKRKFYNIFHTLHNMTYELLSESIKNINLF